MQTKATLLVLFLWSNLANNQIFAAEDESQISTPLQNQSLVLHNSKDFLPFIDGDALEGENSLELLNDSNSSDELVTSSSEFSDNLKDILREDSEDEGKEGSTYAMEDNIYDDNYDYDYSEEDEEYNGEQESDLNDKESDQESESDFDMRTNENMSTISAEVNVLTTEGKSSDEETTETSTNRSIMIEPEDSLVETSLVSETSLVESSLVEESLVETSLVEESLVDCFYVAPSSTFANLPDSISCSCAGAASTFKVLLIIDPEIILIRYYHLGKSVSSSSLYTKIVVIIIKESHPHIINSSP